MRLEILNQRIADESISETEKVDGCPYLKVDNEGPYCSKGLSPGKDVSIERRGVCDALSLRVWCLSIDNCSRCIFYGNNAEFDD